MPRFLDGGVLLVQNLNPGIYLGKVYMELGSYFLFLQEQIKDIIIIILTPPPELQHIQTYEKEKEKLKLA